MPEVVDAGPIFWVSGVMSQRFLGSLDVPIHARALDADGELVKGDHFVAPTFEEGALGPRLNEKRLF